ncbi:MAG: hypothetical protein H0V95_01755, partial [Actinobacteria bacterium]|nr:hypothetical protein [Actinomycetota bacterium]
MRTLVAGLTAAALGATALPAAAQEEAVTVERDVVYRTVDGEELGADVYLPPGDGDERPVVLIVHGGGWVRGDKALFAEEGDQ